MATSEKKSISTRQLIIFYCIYTFAIKFLALPQLLSLHAGHDAWIAALVGTIVELLLLIVVLNVIVAWREKGIYKGLSENMMEVGSRVVFVAMGALLLLQLLIMTGLLKSLVLQSLFHDLSPQLFLIPLVLFGMSFCFAKTRAVFRSGEIFYLLIAVGLILSVLPAITSIDVAEVTPVMANGLPNIFRAVFANLIFFESAIFLLLFAGDIKVTKDFRKKFFSFATLAGVIFVLFVFMATAVFGPLMPLKNMAVIDMTTHSQFLATSGRMDWILISIWLLLLLMRFGVTFYCLFTCLRKIFGIKEGGGYWGILIAVVIWVFWTFVILEIQGLYRFIDDWQIAIGVTILLIPLVCIINVLLGQKRRSKENAVDN